jgi:hypothetical protein
MANPAGGPRYRLLGDHYINDMLLPGGGGRRRYSVPLHRSRRAAYPSLSADAASERGGGGGVW